MDNVRWAVPVRPRRHPLDKQEAAPKLMLEQANAIGSTLAGREGHMKRKNKDNQLPHPPAKRKISEMIWEFASDFIRLGNTQGQKEARLIAVSSAWNIACNPPEQQQKVLDRYMTGYLRFNPDTNRANAAAIRSDMENLVERKLRLFPRDLRQIASAQLVPTGDKDRIEVISARIG